MGDDNFLEVHVDETGDRGFGPRASPIFCLAACVFRHSKAHLVTAAMRDLNESLGRANVPMHAREHLRKHDRKMEACERLGALKGTVRLLYVVLPKNLVDSGSYLRDPIGAYLNALAPAVWGKRELESHAVKSMVDGWHQSQSWWPSFADRVPVQ